MGKRASGGGRATATATAIRTANTAAAASELRDDLERKVRIETEMTQIAYNVWREENTKEDYKEYRRALRLRNRTIDRYEKAAERSRLLNVPSRGRG